MSDYMPPEDPMADSYGYEDVPAEPPPPPPPVVEEPPAPPPPPPPPVDVVEPPPPPPVDVAEPPPPPPVDVAEPPPPPVDVADPPPVDLPEPPPIPDEPPPMDDVPLDAGPDLADDPVTDLADGTGTDLADAPPLDDADVSAPDWAADGQQPFQVSPPEHPFDSAVGPGQPFDVSWEDQGDTNYCATCGPAALVSELTGVRTDPASVEGRAADNGLLNFGETGDVRGTSVESAADLLASYGIDTTTSSGEADAWERLDAALAADRRVVLPLDQPGGSDFAVAVTGVDHAGGMVRAGDSATDSPIQIPMDSFEEAWRASDFSLISADSGPYDLLGMTMHPTIGVQTEAQPLADLPENGAAALGDWWASAESPASCCSMPDDPAPNPLEFTDTSGQVHELTGIDTTGTGQADLATLDANADGQADTWLFDTTGTGQANLLYYDSSGSGMPDSVSSTGDATGAWTNPVPLNQSITIMPDYPASTDAPGISIGSEQAANAGAPTIEFQPTIYMLPNVGQADALGADILADLANGPRGPQIDFGFANVDMARFGSIGDSFSISPTPAGTQPLWSTDLGRMVATTYGSGPR